jgi:arabinofuranosyltransferase
MFASLPTALELRRSRSAAAHRHAGFILLVLVFLTYAAIFIYRTSFVINGERYFSLFDDAMVSMRYARNFAAGNGIVWNPGGDRVEGYTNPLWMAYMALVHLLPLAESKTSLVVQSTAGVLLAVNLWYVYLIALRIANGSSRVALGAAALTASYLPINNWSLQGMEVSALVPLTTFCILQAIKSLELNTFPKSMYLLLGIGTWVRLDVTVMLGAFLAFMFFSDRPRRWKHFAWGVTVLAIACGVQTAIRLWYYGDLAPNTYYLKIAGIPWTVRAIRGLWVLAQFAWNANPFLFALPFVLLLQRDRRIALILWIAVAQFGYSVYVGGDAWEYWGGSNRYICPVMPAFFVLLAYALDLLISGFLDELSGRRFALVRGTLAGSASFAFTIALAIGTMNSIHGVAALAEASLIHPPLHSGQGGENQMDVEQALALRDATGPAATVAVMRAGTIPYFSNRTAVDLLGKNDRHIAHELPRITSNLSAFREFRPGHVKFDFAYSLGRLAPDVVLQLRRRQELASPFLQGYEGVLLNGVRIYVRSGSRNVFRDRLHPAPNSEDPQSSLSNSARGLPQGVLSGS